MWLHEHSGAVFWSVALHAAVAVALTVSVDFRRQQPRPQMLAIEAVVVDETVLARAEQKAEEERQAALRRQEEERREQERQAELRRQEEQRREQERQAELRRQEEQRLEQERQAELRRQEEQRLEQERQAELRRQEEQRREAERQAELRRQEEERREAERQAELRRQEEERREAERQAELRRQEEQRRQEEERQRQMALEAELERAAAEEAERMAAARSGALDRYIALITNKIEQNWTRPASARAGIDCTVRVTQIPNGEVVDARVVNCNGDDAVVRSIEAAVLRASPLPLPEPRSLFERTLNVRFIPGD